MSRRDTIIVAVLVNAALLMILFATAMRSDHPKENKKKSQKVGDTKIEDLAAGPLAIEGLSSGDLLSEFVNSVPNLAESGGDNFFSFEETEITLATPSPLNETSVVLPRVLDEVKISKPKTEEQYVNVTVKKGDFLEKIAKANNTTVAAIVKANNLSSTQLKIGQVLKVPLSDGKKPPQQKPAFSPSQSSTTEVEYYIVKEGDNPWLIANRNKINLEELLRINGLDEQKAKRLRPGDKLKIR